MSSSVAKQNDKWINNKPNLLQYRCSLKEKKPQTEQIFLARHFLANNSPPHVHRNKLVEESSVIKGSNLQTWVTVSLLTSCCQDINLIKL